MLSKSQFSLRKPRRIRLLKPQRINPKWQRNPVIVAAPGPSLTSEVVEAIDVLSDEWRVIVVQDAYRLMPWADVLYGCDARWWNKYNGCMDFEGEKWASHCAPKQGIADDKTEIAEKYGVNLVTGSPNAGFSTDQSLIHYGDNSGFQALNLAILLGSEYIVLVGFDMRHVSGKSHFFGDHPKELFQRREYESFALKFDKAPPPEGVTIINATPCSALKCYEMMGLDEAVDI
jgi:hypothetical protein